jgi:hypothetical protein
MSGALAALRDGARRVNRAPAILFGVWALTAAAALLPAIALGRAIQRDLGSSLVADSVAAGLNYEWLRAFAARGDSLAPTMQPTILGFAAVLDNASAVADGTPRPAAIVAIAIVYVGCWLFLAGGVIDRYARDHATRSHGFFAACGVFFFRFMRLAVVQAIVYAFLVGLTHPWLFDRLYPRMVAGVASQQTAFTVRLVLYAAYGLLLAAANLIFDYAKVRAVVEDRRSILGALANAVGFIERNYAAVMTLYVLDVLVVVVTGTMYGMVAPEVGRGALVWIVVGLGQLFVAARLWVKLLFWASETALFQRRLAHAGYVARPEAVWPESPAAEAIG